MKKLLQLSVAIERPDLLLDMLDELAARKYDIGFSHEWAPSPWKALETASVETYVRGTMDISFDEGAGIKMPFISNFIFTSVKELNGMYRPEFSFSLS